MSTAAFKTMPVNDEWRRWIAENLMLDAAPQALYDMLVRSGVAAAEARREVE